MEPLTLPETTYLLIQNEEKKKKELINNMIISIMALLSVFTLVIVLWLTKISN